MIVGVCGFIGSGKDTVADFLTNNYNFTHESFAGNLKDAVDQTSNISRETKVHARRRRLKGIKRESDQRRQSARQKEISVDEKPPLKNGDEEKLPNQKPPLPN